MNRKEPRSGELTTISHYIGRLKQEDSLAAQQIWQNYFERLIPLARKKMRGLAGVGADEEDILISVFDRFFRAAREGRFAKLDDRDDLWQILLMLVDRKVADQYRKENAAKRGGGKVAREADLGKVNLEQIRELVDRDPDPEYILEFNEHLKRALARLRDEKTREVAVLRLEGLSNSEIATRMAISLSSVERKLRVIREVWENEFL